LIDLMRQPRVIERARELRVTDVRTVRRILARIFALAHGSVEYKPLVPAIVEASGLPGSLVVDGTAVPEPAVAATADEQAIQRPLLQFFWAETLQLPREQRLALLLHLEGREGIHALWERGAVSRTQVARALSLTEEQLGGLPWSNLQIADYIESGVAPPVTRATTVGNRDPKRDQRINKWRHDARRALENRIRAYLAGTGLDNRRASSTSYVLRPFLNRSAS
jgi:hypothetical protein